MKRLTALIAAIGCACMGELTGITVNPITVSPVSVATVSVTNADSDVAAAKPDLARLQALCGNNNLHHYVGKNIDAVALADWCQVYEEGKEELASVGTLPDGIRMIAELRSVTHANDNLAYYKRLGYNAVLIPITSPVDEPARLKQLAEIAVSNGMSPWLAWSAPEDVLSGVYPRLSRIQEQFQAILPYCQGMILSWRGTSIHLFYQDEIYAGKLCALAQENNPELCIVDEAYWGENRKVEGNSITGASGTYISGWGFASYHPAETLKRYFAQLLANRKCLGLVVGAGGYYASRHNKGLSWQEALQAKIAVEQEMLQGGCCGTITLHGDASDTGSSLQSTDDIGLYPIEE